MPVGTTRYTSMEKSGHYEMVFASISLFTKHLNKFINLRQRKSETNKIQSANNRSLRNNYNRVNINMQKDVLIFFLSIYFKISRQRFLCKISSSSFVLMSEQSSWKVHKKPQLNAEDPCGLVVLLSTVRACSCSR